MNEEETPSREEIERAVADYGKLDISKHADGFFDRAVGAFEENSSSKFVLCHEVKEDLRFFWKVSLAEKVKSCCKLFELKNSFPLGRSISDDAGTHFDQIGKIDPKWNQQKRDRLEFLKKKSANKNLWQRFLQEKQGEKEHYLIFRQYLGASIEYILKKQGKIRRDSITDMIVSLSGQPIDSYYYEAMWDFFKDLEDLREKMLSTTETSGGVGGSSTKASSPTNGDNLAKDAKSRAKGKFGGNGHSGLNGNFLTTSPISFVTDFFRRLLGSTKLSWGLLVIVGGTSFLLRNFDSIAGKILELIIETRTSISTFFVATFWWLDNFTNTPYWRVFSLFFTLIGVVRFPYNFFKKINNGSAAIKKKIE